MKKTAMNKRPVIRSSIIPASQRRPDSNPAVIYDRAYRTQVIEPRLERAAKEARNRLA